MNEVEKQFRKNTKVLRSNREGRYLILNFEII